MLCPIPVPDWSGSGPDSFLLLILFSQGLRRSWRFTSQTLSSFFPHLFQFMEVTFRYGTREGPMWLWGRNEEKEGPAAHAQDREPVVRPTCAYTMHVPVAPAAGFSTFLFSDLLKPGAWLRHLQLQNRETTNHANLSTVHPQQGAWEKTREGAWPLIFPSTPHQSPPASPNMPSSSPDFLLWYPSLDCEPFLCS